MSNLGELGHKYTCKVQSPSLSHSLARINSFWVLGRLSILQQTFTRGKIKIVYSFYIIYFIFIITFEIIHETNDNIHINQYMKKLIKYKSYSTIDLPEVRRVSAK